MRLGVMVRDGKGRFLLRGGKDETKIDRNVPIWQQSTTSK